MTPLVTGLYILAFGMFIYGLMGLTGPKTAVECGIKPGPGGASFWPLVSHGT